MNKKNANWFAAKTTSFRKAGGKKREREGRKNVSQPNRKSFPQTFLCIKTVVEHACFEWLFGCTCDMIFSYELLVSLSLTLLIVDALRSLMMLLRVVLPILNLSQELHTCFWSYSCTDCVLVLFKMRKPVDVVVPVSQTGERFVFHSKMYAEVHHVYVDVVTDPVLLRIFLLF